ncbi:MAG: molybdopterin-dependent oxidoreductase, partial [Bacteroides sp.]|nr:molybdopterin-dependent oxidoreductase [Bacteroides sp.]
MANRRDFIKISGLGLGGLAVSASALGVYRNLSTSPPLGEEMKLDAIRTPTICEICFWKCAGWVYKNEEGKIWKVVGNDEDQHSNGRFCPRGTGGPGMYYDDDRLKTPKIRTEERGKQVFRDVSWDEAFDYIAEKMK